MPTLLEEDAGQNVSQCLTREEQLAVTGQVIFCGVQVVPF